jgi:hypothetical protein
MDEEQVLAEYLGYVGDVDGVDYTARYVYRETTVEVLADALRLVTYDEPRDRDETVKALAILKTHGWRRDVLPFSFRRRLVPWNALAEAQIMPQQGDSRYGRLRLAYARHHTLDRVMHRRSRSISCDRIRRGSSAVSNGPRYDRDAPRRAMANVGRTPGQRDRRRW